MKKDKELQAIFDLLLEVDLKVNQLLGKQSVPDIFWAQEILENRIGKRVYILMPKGECYG